MYISDLLTADCIELAADVKTKDEVIGRLAELLEKNGIVTDKALFSEAVMAREALGSTGISAGIAIPHAKSEAVARLSLSVITVPDGVDFQARDGKPSKIFFMIAAPKDANDLHIEMLGHISLILIDAANREKLLQAESADRFLSYLDRMEAKKFVGVD